MASTLFFTPISRIAPTPSGYLHEGNAYNFILTWLHVRASGGRLRLRIDDMDAERSRPEFLEDIFRSLEWLGLDWDDGPFSIEQHQKNFSQHLFKDLYLETLGTLKEKELLFACDCSRRELEGLASYPGTCLGKRHYDSPVAYRFSSLPDQPLSLLNEAGSQQTYTLPKEMNYSVLQRKDGLPAYQLVSLVDDIRHGINFIVRGEDLLPSTLFQLHLSSFLPKNDYSGTRFLHHSLLKAGDEKLSKSKGALALFQLKEKEKTPAALFRRFSQWTGLPAPAESADQALEQFISRR